MRDSKKIDESYAREKNLNTARDCPVLQKTGPYDLLPGTFLCMIHTSSAVKAQAADIFCQTVLPVGKPEPLLVLSLFLKRLKIKSHTRQQNYVIFSI